MIIDNILYFTTQLRIDVVDSLQNVDSERCDVNAVDYNKRDCTSRRKQRRIC